MDRYCPTCLEYKKEVWLENHKQDILDIKYYHIVMIIPRNLYPLFYYNQEKMYDLFFKVSSDTIIESNLKYLGINVGLTSILHTWSQKGKYYLHIHILATGGGVNKLGKWINSDLVDNEVIQNNFKKKFIKELKHQRLEFYSEYSYLNNYDNYIKYLDNVSKEEFKCYKKKPYNNVTEIYEYFAKYAFKVCISNDRIKKIDNNYVYFTYKNYENKKKKMHKLRLITRTKKTEEKLIEKIEILRKIFSKEDITKCPCCGGQLTLYKEYYLNKSPPNIYKK